ncbi:putative Transcriptional regulator, XRE family [Desulfamplus magnetovallimortis]|uniref:Putative Transcriptional regulator, XRE family n=1 Tax=Desulfamplus magnetovallimortis TaxID=1246637 RepID=A0A1W1HBD6_9BACT|nr:helix-turn-helix transcriptional regulator [Desulfamplus magnetovallimortis]SLM29790.1 putative Transcriptional regulator, XRE family [Desulfamplus magnetovallimortis]
MDTKQMIGARIQRIRKMKGFTQDKLAEYVNISPKYLSSVERGKENPTLNTLISLSESLDSDLDEFFNLVQLEDPETSRKMIIDLLDKAEPEQLKTIYKILAVIVESK